MRKLFFLSVAIAVLTVWKNVMTETFNLGMAAMIIVCWKDRWDQEWP